LKIAPAALVLCLILQLSPACANALTVEKRIDLVSLFATKVPVMLQFGKSWCPRCQSTKPILDSVTRTYAGNALIVPVDVEANKDLVRDFKIRLIPTQIFLMPDRSEFIRHEGILQEQQIGEILTKMGAQRTPVR
jgi:thioredoxin-like negative regulator of GroEL